MSSKRFGIVSLFPEMFDALFHFGVVGRAKQNALVDVSFWNPRDFAHDKHKTVDDRPFGGGPGMVMKVAPLAEAIHEAKLALPNAKVAMVSPQGKRFDHDAAIALRDRSEWIVVSGRYEGIDQRLIETLVDEEWSIGDYVLSGGELPVMVMLDAIIRLLPGVLGDEHSALQDSFAHEGLLDCPHYTRPRVLDGRAVPEVLFSGDHEAIRRWRLKASLGQTWLKRPDLLHKVNWTEEKRSLLKAFIEDLGGDPQVPEYYNVSFES